MNAKPPPTGPLDCLIETLPAGTVVFRVHPAGRGGDEFNPGFGPRTRFAFFGAPVVPVLYAGETPESAVFETIFHDTVPDALVPARDWRGRMLSVVEVRRPLRLAKFHSDGLRRLKLHARDLTDTPASTYRQTVAWAEAVHREGLDGIVWMSRQFNTDRAYVLFGDRVNRDDLVVVQNHSETRTFALPTDEEWLAVLGDRIGVALSFGVSSPSGERRRGSRPAPRPSTKPPSGQSGRR